MAINLKTVISELNFALELSIDQSDDPRLKQLLKDAAADLAAVTKAMGKADDPPINPNPPGNKQ